MHNVCKMSIFLTSSLYVCGVFQRVEYKAQTIPHWGYDVFLDGSCCWHLSPAGAFTVPVCSQCRQNQSVWRVRKSHGAACPCLPGWNGAPHMDQDGEPLLCVKSTMVSHWKGLSSGCHLKTLKQNCTHTLLAVKSLLPPSLFPQFLPKLIGGGLTEGILSSPPMRFERNWGNEEGGGKDLTDQDLLQPGKVKSWDLLCFSLVSWSPAVSLTAREDEGKHGWIIY